MEIPAPALPTDRRERRGNCQEHCRPHNQGVCKLSGARDGVGSILSRHCNPASRCFLFFSPPSPMKSIPTMTKTEKWEHPWHEVQLHCTTCGQLVVNRVEKSSVIVRGYFKPCPCFPTLEEGKGNIGLPPSKKVARKGEEE